MPEAGIGAMTRFLKLLGAEEDSERVLNNICGGWDLIRPLGRGEITSLEAQQLLVEIRARVANFQPGVLDVVRAFGGQFGTARLTTVPGGETLESQRDGKVIKFRTDWYFKGLEPGEKLTVTPSIASEVIYLSSVVDGSLGCTYEPMEGDKPNVQEVLDTLTKVEGLQWIVGNTPTVLRVLANHLQETDGREYLLRGIYTWTTDAYESPSHGLERLIAGLFAPDGVLVSYLGPFESGDSVGVFALGVP